jgi:hypothetical protein
MPAVREHYVIAFCLLDTFSHDVAFAAMGFVPDDFKFYFGWNPDIFRCFCGMIFTAVIDNDNLAGEVMGDKKIRRRFYVTGDFPAFFIRRYYYR